MGRFDPLRDEAAVSQVEWSKVTHSRRMRLTAFEQRKSELHQLFFTAKNASIGL
jgi:hypothetical protein